MKKILILLIVLVLCLFAATGCNKPCDPEKECCDGKGVNCPCEGYDCPCEGYDCPCEGYDCPCEGDDCIQPDCDPEVECCDGEGKCDCDKNSVICKIQTGLIAEGTEVKVSECVVTGIFYTEDENHNRAAIKGIYVSDIIPEAKPYTGIYVFIKATAPVDDYAIGDKLEVSGKYTEYYESSQIEMIEIKKLGKADLPEPAEITDTSTIATPFVFVEEESEWNPTANHGADTEAYESVLVKVTNVEITNSNLGHGAFEVTGDLAIDKSLYYYPKDLRTEGREFESIEGILIYDHNAFKLAPRALEDFVEREQPPITDDDDVTDDDDDVTDNDDVTDDDNATDDDSVTDDDIVEPSPATIKEIQGGEKEKKDLVRIENAVIISPVLSKNFDDSTTGYTFYVSDGNKGDYSGLLYY